MSRLGLLVLLVACSRSPAPVQPQRMPREAAPAPLARSPLRDVISAARSYVCARTADAHVACWGLLANGGEQLTPALVAGIEHVVGVAAGFWDTCAWHDDGGVSCWAQIGADHAPHRVAKLDRVVQVAADAEMMCARRDDGTVACWQRDLQAPHGDAPPPEVHAIAGIRDAAEVAVAEDAACARLVGGTVTCWRGVKPARLDPIVEAKGAISLAGGTTTPVSETASPAHFGAVLADGRVVGWDAQHEPWPVPVLPADVVRLDIGADGVCALGAAVTCWKVDSTTRQQTTPHELAGTAGATEVSVGDTVACVRTAAGRASCWGIVDRLGIGKSYEQTLPVEVVDLDDAVQLAAGGTICARRANGHVACWGERPVDLSGVTGAIEVAVSAGNGCARLQGGKTTCWSTQSRDKPAEWRPTVVPELAGATALVSTRGTTCGVRSGKVLCPNAHGRFEAVRERKVWSGGVQRHSWSCAQLARGFECTRHFAGRRGEPAETSLDTALAKQLAGAADVVMHELNIYVLRKSGSVEVADAFDGRFHPVGALDDAIAIARGPDRVGGTSEDCALRRSGEVVCWTESFAPSPVTGLTDVIQLAGNEAHLCALRKTGKVMCWGMRDGLGDDGQSTVPTPTLVGGLAL